MVLKCQEDFRLHSEAFIIKLIALNYKNYDLDEFTEAYKKDGGVSYLSKYEGLEDEFEEIKKDYLRATIYSDFYVFHEADNESEVPYDRVEVHNSCYTRFTDLQNFYYEVLLQRDMADAYFNLCKQKAVKSITFKDFCKASEFKLLVAKMLKESDIDIALVEEKYNEIADDYFSVLIEAYKAEIKKDSALETSLEDCISFIEKHTLFPDKVRNYIQATELYQRVQKIYRITQLYEK